MPLWHQLELGARLVVPLGRRSRAQRLCVIERADTGPRLLGQVPVRFVPLIGAEAY
jgi:protein-L-isoaspartate O-methyltransferase